MEDVKREIEIMKRLDHPNIIKLYEVIDDSNEEKVFLILEYAEGGVVMAGQLETEPLPEDKARQYIRDVVNGLEYLHDRNIIHRDIKPENLLLSVDGVVKISDFSISLHLEQTDDDQCLKRTIGSPAFLAPEICASETPRIQGPPIDLWSLGITLYLFIFGKLPFMAENEVLLFDKIRTQELSFLQPTDEDLKNLLSSLLEKNPDKRITVKQVKQHPWLLKNLSKKQLGDNAE